MDFGAHLPLIDFDGRGFALAALLSYADTARSLGYAAVAANDHLVFRRPWLDGPTALAAVVAPSGGMALMTTVALPVVRGPVQVAKTLGAIDLLSGGRLLVGVSAGSSRADYTLAGLDFDERWKRLDETVRMLRAVWGGETYRGRYYTTDGGRLEPRPTRNGGLPIWIGSWGSDAGLRRTARLADGWLASAYNTTPDAFRAGWQRLGTLLAGAGKDPATFPNALSTMWTFVTESRAEAHHIIRDVLATLLDRDPEDLAAKLLVGPAEDCAAKLRQYRDAGVQRVLIWPVADPIHQLERFKTRVAPLVGDGS